MTDLDAMQAALAQARLAQATGEVPVGAVVLRDGRLLATGHNRPITDRDPTAHAEIVALRAAAAALGTHRLDGCELFVTLEPCAMCVGAIQHARIGRVVYGASDPKAGALGSALDVPGLSPVKHRLAVESGLLADECGALLRQFFRLRREQERTDAQPLRDDALRTPDERFASLPDWPWPPQYVTGLPALAGLRMHCLDLGPRDAARTWLCLHGNPAWGYLYRRMIPVFEAGGDRVVVPDLPGFGRSDKPKREQAHRFDWHRQVLLELVDALDLQQVVLVVQDWGGLLGLTLPMEAPARYAGLLAMNTFLATGDRPLSAGFLAWREWCARNPDYDIAALFGRGNPQLSPQERAAYAAPFPDSGHRAALRAFPRLVPEEPDADGAAVSRAARDFWRSQWQGRTLMAVGARDPVLGPPVMDELRQIIRGCPDPLVIEQAGHFVQEHGAPIARTAVEYFSA